MSVFRGPAYDGAIDWIKWQIVNGASWSDVENACADDGDIAGALENLVVHENWPDEFEKVDVWQEFVCEIRRNEPIPVVIKPAGIDNGIQRGNYTQNGMQSSSRRYLDSLLEEGISSESIANIDEASKWVLNRCKRDTTGSEPVKGLVYGSVQSGKTSNMAALMSLAADQDWNIFIILSGTIESLRCQTQHRFDNDLKSTTAVTWDVLDLSGKDRDKAASSLILNTLNYREHSMRYVTVCLKQKNRLEALVNWLYSCPDRTKRMRIILIDDEADQASINTANIIDPDQEDKVEQERKTINRLICNLVNGKTGDGGTPPVGFQSMNYICYTATPYANLLNETSGDSLYPRDFIRTLADPKEYFGPKVIFGNGDEDSCPGLDIIRTIPASDERQIKEIHDGVCFDLPNSYQDSIAWFLSASAVLRTKGFKKPISMLVHTSSKIDDHNAEYAQIRCWLNNGAHHERIIELCKTVYQRETKRFTYSDFEQAFSAYGGLSSMDKALPPFSEIRLEIQEILQEVRNISEEEGLLTYSPGINLCLDNSQANSIGSPEDHPRIAYPTREELDRMRKAPIFIVVGGNTLSRGLTIEGLVCTFFARNVGQADSLMQMGRWFGYKKGYELLQRIWMTEKSEQKYEALAKIDIDLKEEFISYMERGLSPSQIAPKISTIPEISRFLIAAKNKTQLAVPCSFDFSGFGPELTRFPDDAALLQEAINCTEAFLDKCGRPEKSEPGVPFAMCWRGLDFSSIADYLDRLSGFMTGEASFRQDLPTLLDWIGQNSGPSKRYSDWNVAVAGKRPSGAALWEIQGCELPTIERSRKVDRSYIDIGSLRSGRDAICDVRTSALTPQQLGRLKDIKTNRDIIPARADLGLPSIPLLIVYRIRHDGSVAKTQSSGRVPMNTTVDPIGVSVIVPGDHTRDNATTAVQAKLG